MHETLATLVWHTHVARHQAAEWRRLLDGLQPGEVALSMDFFENASFAPNRSPQSNYWGKIQATNFIAITWLWACDSDGTERRVKTEHVLRAGSTPAPVDPLACLLQEAQRRHFELVTWSTECL